MCFVFLFMFMFTTLHTEHIYYRLAIIWSFLHTRCQFVNIKQKGRTWTHMHASSPIIIFNSIFFTFPPAFLILLCSISSSGLWSADISTALPSRQTTHLKQTYVINSKHANLITQVPFEPHVLNRQSTHDLFYY